MDRRILILDDEPAITFALVDYFTRCGYRVDTAGDVDQGLRLLLSATYEVVLTDLSLRGRGGVEGLRIAAQARREQPRTRVVLMSADDSHRARAAAREAGCDAFLPKPVSLQALAEAIAGLLPS